MKRLLAALLLALACACNSTPAASGVPLLDEADSGVPFTQNEIVPVAALSDFTALPTDEIAAFLASTPYNSESFLATYQSNGLLAAEGIAKAATAYRINPIVLLVAIEVQAQLIARTSYPSPPSIVDYVFGCGCSAPGVCDAQAAGLDVQVGCYANALRTSLDAIASASNRETPGGWGPGTTTTSLDGVNVTPTDASTAALYQSDPVVGSGTSGMSLFAKVWVLYLNALNYDPQDPVGPGATALVGDPCIGADDCNVPKPVCANATTYPGGLCTTACTGMCPTPQSFCASFVKDGYCLAICSPTDGASCRTGYTCQLVDAFGSDAGPQYVCATPP